jgi:hypothetical protein
MNEQNKEKMLNLLADQAIFGLTEDEAAELEKLKREFPEFREDTSFEMTAAAINLSNLETSETLPAHLQAKIINDAEEFFGNTEKKQSVFNFKSSIAGTSAGEPVRNIVETSPITPWSNWLGWGVAALACIALAVNLWMTRVQPTTTPEIVKNPETVQAPTPKLSPQQELEQLLASGKDVLRTEWTEPDPKKAKQIGGDIVWSNTEQKGYMRFRNLPVNDPNRETYQLWIFDEYQSDKYPIDGGVFDAGNNGEVVVPIDPKIAVKSPKMFVVTMEKPGGVVVSDRQKLVVLAKV